MGTDLPPVPGASQNDSDRILAVLCHISMFFGLPFLLPLIVFLVKRESGSWVSEHAKEALNFHLTLFLYGIVCFVLFFFLIGIPLAVVLGIFAAVCAIIAAIRAVEGGFYRYPITLRLF